MNLSYKQLTLNESLEIIESNNGSIDIKSEKGKGTEGQG